MYINNNIKQFDIYEKKLVLGVRLVMLFYLAQPRVVAKDFIARIVFTPTLFTIF